MGRILEFDLLKAFALFLLFVYHSSLSLSFPGQLWFVQMYLLSAFFIASGYFFLAYVKKYPVFDIAAKKMARVWIPLSFGLLLVLIFNLIPGSEPLAFLYHAMGLSIFYALQAGNLNLFHLWYLVHLLWYFAIFALLYKLVAGEKNRTLVVAILFIIFSFLWASNSILKLEWKFLFFLWIFYFGMILAEKNRVKMIINSMSSNLLLPVALLFICALSTMATPAFPFSNQLVSEMINMPVFIIIRNVFCITAVLLSLWIFSKFPKSMAKPSEFIGYGLIFSFILQPFVSGAVLFFISNLEMAIPISFSISVLFGYIIQLYYDMVLKKIKSYF